MSPAPRRAATKRLTSAQWRKVRELVSSLLGSDAGSDQLAAILGEDMTEQSRDLFSAELRERLQRAFG